MKATLTIGTALFATAISGTSFGDTAAFDKAMQPILVEYLTIQDALAKDKLTGVISSAKKIQRLVAKVNPKSVTGKHAKHYAALPKNVKSSAKELAKAKTIDKSREAFKALSRPMAMWATMSKPEHVNVVFCSMAKGSWLQKGTKIRNPYYGAKMLGCGEVVSGKAKGKASGHMGGGMHHH